MQSCLPPTLAHARAASLIPPPQKLLYPSPPQLTREFDLLGSWNRLALDPCILAEPSLLTSVVYTGVSTLQPPSVAPAYVPPKGPRSAHSALRICRHCCGNAARGSCDPPLLSCWLRSASRTGRRRHDCVPEGSWPAGDKLTFAEWAVHAWLAAGQWMPFPLSELDLVVRTQIHDLLDVSALC